MLANRLLSTFALVGLMVAPAVAQSPSTPSTQPSRPSAAAPATAPAVLPTAKKVDLNTATAAELDALPDVGATRSKAILDERAKGPFKDWADFDKRMTGTSVNAGVKEKIQKLVTF